MSENSVNSIEGEIMTSEQLVTYIQQGGKECVSSGRALVNRREQAPALPKVCRTRDKTAFSRSCQQL